MAPPSSYTQPNLDLSIKSRGSKRIKNLPEHLRSSSGSDLYNQISNATGLSVHRLRITATRESSHVVARNLSPLDRAALAEGVEVKDLGPQIAWRTVFLIEYLGPLLIHPAVYALRPLLYAGSGGDRPASYAQWLTLVLCSTHFAKRELETLFVHRFSAATMPAFNIVKNSGHYWALSGALIAYFTYSPTAVAARPMAPTDPLLLAGLALFVVGEVGNGINHLQLSALRPAGTTVRQVPRGLGFNWVTCPNYFFEIVAWTGILLVSQSWSTGVFIAVAAAQMAAWAWKKEKRYRKEFGDKYKKKRYAMIPGLI